MKILLAIYLSLFLFIVNFYAESEVVIGSKKFTESVILGEIILQLVRNVGVEASHRQELGGSRILWNALLNGDIDIYPEYSGTICKEILANQVPHDLEAITTSLKNRDILMSRSLGFNNTYIIGMREERAREMNIKNISDLKSFPHLKFGFSNEFMDRKDGWPGLKKHYGLPQRNIRGLDHDIAYRGLENGHIDVIDLYSTDAEIQYYGIRRIIDNKRYFPRYESVILYRKDLKERSPEGIRNILQLEGSINESQMIRMNAKAKLARVSEKQVASEFIKSRFSIESETVKETMLSGVIRYTGEHILLVVISLSAAIIVSIPLGILAAKKTKIGKIILACVGIIQTIPSLALLVFMIPLLGIGGPPALMALFLYSLLPIVRNTFTGLSNIPQSLCDSAKALGLTPRARLMLIELPLASRTILAGVKTSAVINVGTATLGALIGAGGYGQPILTGIRLDDVSLILQGAIPAACLALIVQFIFDLFDRIFIPKGLRMKSSEN
jgi:osmoprotectant transport system permease protein